MRRIPTGRAISLAVLLLAVILAGSMPSQAFAIPITAEASMTIDGNDWTIPVEFDPGSGFYGVGTWDSEIEDFTGFSLNVPGEFEVSISGVLDPDPSISYGVAVTDFGAPSAFAFFFMTPIVLGPGATTVDASVVGGMTDFTGNGVTITPTLPDADGDFVAELQIADVSAPLTNMGVDVGPAFTGGPGPAGAFYGYGPFAAGPQAGPPGPWTTLSISVGFTLTGGSDTAVLTGFAQIVPEPSSVCLWAAGLLSLAYFARRRR